MAKKGFRKDNGVVDVYLVDQAGNRVGNKIATYLNSAYVPKGILIV